MGEDEYSGAVGDGGGLSRRLGWTEPGRPEGRSRPYREAPATGIWRKPGAGAVPTRPATGLFGFSSAEPVRPDLLPRSSGGESDEITGQARRRAFALLDEWLTWISVLDDDSVFALDPSGKRPVDYVFSVRDVIADPVDVVRYATRPSPLL